MGYGRNPAKTRQSGRVEGEFSWTGADPEREQVYSQTFTEKYSV
jgi:hypothetical protein